MRPRTVADFRPSYLMYEAEVSAAVTAVLASGRVLQGDRVRACEELLGRLTGRRHVVLFSSATAAIEALMAESEVGVVTPTVNFVSVPYVARKLGRALALRARTRPLSGPMLDAAVPGLRRWHVPLAGQAGADYAAAVQPQDIEDASQCFLTGPVGRLGRAGVHSFTFNKFATSGEGGSVGTDDDALAEHLQRYRDFGRRPGQAGPPTRYQGYNARLAEPNAALLLVQLQHAAETAAHLSALWHRYESRLTAAGHPPVTAEHDNHTRVVVGAPAGGRAAVAGIRRVLASEHGIATPTPVMDFSIADGDGFAGPEEEGWDHLMCLPFWYGLGEDDIDYVVDRFAAAYSAAPATSPLRARS